jgi:hypothetical protein
VNNFKSQAERVSTVDAYPEEYWDVTEEDEIDPEVVIGNYTFNPSDILRQLDPIAFEMEALNYQDWCLGDCLCEKHDL